jgi:paraquat-inducible protein B
MKKASPTLIGAFVLGAAILAAGGAILFGSGRFFEKTTRVIFYFEGSVNGLSIGAPLKFKGVPIGQVVEIRLLFDEGENTAAIPVVAEIDDGLVSNKLGSEIEMNRQEIERLVSRGLRATLESQSLVTGLLYVSLDLQPDSGAHLFPHTDRYPQIPTLPSTLEQFSETVSEVMHQLREVNFQKLMQGVTDTVAGIDKIVNSPQVAQTIEELDSTMKAVRSVVEKLDSSIGPLTKDVEQTAQEATRVLDTLRQTIEEARELIEPDAPLAYQLEQTIKDVGAAARALQQVAQMIDEQPTVLLYGNQSGADR